MKSTLIIGGTHGDERTGVEVAKFFIRNKKAGIDALIANPEAVSKRKRFIQTDLNRSAGKRNPASKEEKISNNLKAVIKSYPRIVEFHNTTASDNDCSIATCKPNALHFYLCKHFEIKKLLVMPSQGSLSGYNSAKFFSLETQKNSKKYTPKFFISKINKLNLQIPRVSNAGLSIYEFAGATYKKSQLKALGIDLKNLRNFKALSKSVLKKLGIEGRALIVPIFIGEKAYGTDFGMQLAKKI